MAQQKIQVVFDGTEHGTAENPSVLWHSTWHSRKSRWFLMAQKMALQKNPVAFSSTEHGMAEQAGGFMCVI
jgi:hypothetical protein